MGETRVRKSKKTLKLAQVSSEQSNVQTKTAQLSSQVQVQVLVNSVSASEASSAVSRSTQSNTSEEEDFTDHVEVLRTQDKGFAVFTKRKIPVGALLIAEPPLIRLTQAEEDDEKSHPPEDQSTLALKYDSLPKATQRSYLKLHDSQKSTFPRVKSIYYSNCYNLSSKSELPGPATSGPRSPINTGTKDKGGSCIGLLSSRLNHSCVPNVQFSFSESTGLMLFHAIRAIPKGREVFSTYDTVFETRAQRQKKQIMYYGFRCDCDACQSPTPFWERSDLRRKEMIETRGKLRENERMWEEGGGGGGGGADGSSRSSLDNHDIVEDAIQLLVKLEGLLIKEGLMGLPLADTYAALARWAIRKAADDPQITQKWLRKELDVCVACLGPAADRVEAIRLVLEPH